MVTNPNDGGNESMKRRNGTVNDKGCNMGRYSSFKCMLKASVYMLN